MDRAASMNGASTLSPVRDDASRKWTSTHRVHSVEYESKEWRDVPFSAAHRLASAHSTSRSSSRSALFPTRTVTRLGLAKARASANHWDNLVNESRLFGTLDKG